MSDTAGKRDNSQGYDRCAQNPEQCNGKQGMDYSPLSVSKELYHNRVEAMGNALKISKKKYVLTYYTCEL